MRAVLLVLAILLLAGCTTTAPEQPPAQPPVIPSPPANNTTMTCADYCPSQPHVQCVGSWNISGAYPDCICGFECASTTNPSVPASNASNVPAPATTVPAPSAPPALPNQSVSSLMAEGIPRLRNDFYSGHSGMFLENTYSWITEQSASPGELTVSPTEVEFNGAASFSIRASAFLVFTDASSSTKAVYGLAIFQDQPILENFTSGFSVRYLSPVIHKGLEGCSSYSIGYNSDPQGRPLFTYFFTCERVADI